MSALTHPKGTRLALQRANPTAIVAPTGARIVSGRTKAMRPSQGLTAPIQQTHTVGGITTGVSGATIAARAATVTSNGTGKSGKTIAARTVNTSPPVTSSTGDLHPTDTAIMSDPAAATTGAKSGATLFQRNLTNLEIKIIETIVIVGLLVGGIFVVKKYKLLQGGR